MENYKIIEKSVVVLILIIIAIASLYEFYHLGGTDNITETVNNFWNK